MPAFDVLTNPTKLPPLKPGDKKAIVVTATNRLPRAVTGRAVAVVEPRAFATMVKPPAKAQQTFSQAGVTQEFPFSVEIPADAKAGSFTVRVDVVDVDHQDDNFGQSPVLNVVIEAAVIQPPPPPPKKWWLWAAIAAGVVVLGVVVWILIPKGPKMPDVVGMRFADAQTKLVNDSIRIMRVDTLNTDTSTYKADVVIEQKPKGGTRLNKDRDSNIVRLVVETPFAVVPALRGQLANDANHTLGLAGFPNIRGWTICNTTPAFNGKVFEVRPAERTLQPKSTIVDFWVGAYPGLGISCPPVRSPKAIELRSTVGPAIRNMPTVRVRPDS